MKNTIKLLLVILSLPATTFSDQRIRITGIVPDS